MKNYKKIQVNKYSRNKWKSILLDIYNDNSPQKYILTQINSEDLKIGIKFLKENNLIKEKRINNSDDDNETSKQIILTRDGFSVARDLEKQQIADKTNIAIMCFTMIITFTGIMQIYLDVLNTNIIKSFVTLIYLIFVVIVICTIYKYLKNKEWAL